MRAKFIDPPREQALSSRLPAPPANQLAEEMLHRAAQSFPKGAGAGPSGLRPDWVKQMLKEPGGEA
eukprot:10759178-Karenia_brevis.AAC.1